MKTISIFLFLIGLTWNLPAADFHVSAAASLTDVLKEIAAGYEFETGDKPVFNFGASSILARQIEEGAPADLFISADEEKMDQLEKKKLLKAGTRKSLLSNSLVIVVEQDSKLTINSPQDLTNLKRLAVAETKTVPAGIYARKYLESINLWEKVSNKIIPTENVRAALSAVESGNVDAGIVYKTDAAISKRTKIAYAVPRKDSPNISYPFAVINSGKQQAEAQRFLNYLASEKMLKFFEKHGFIINK